MAESLLDDSGVDSCLDQCGGVAVTEIVQADLRQVVFLEQTLPLLCHGVGLIRCAIGLFDDIAMVLEANAIGEGVSRILRPGLRSS